MPKEPSNNGHDEFVNSDDMVTPVERPARNPLNRPLVTVLHNLALSFEAFPRAILEIARAIQDDPVAVHELHRKKVGETVIEAGQAVIGYGQEIIGGT